VIAEGHALYPNVAALFGLTDLRVVDPAQPALARAYVAAQLVGPRGARAPWPFVEPRDSSPQRLASLGVRYCLTPRRRELPSPWHAIFQGGGGRLWELERPAGWFYAPASVERVGDLAAARDGTAGIADPFALAVIESPAPSARAANRVGVRTWRARPNGFELELDARAGGVVASSVSWASGWQVAGFRGGRGEPPAIVRANGAFLALAIPPGVEAIELRYRPRGFGFAVALSALGALAMAGLARGAR
jgi:hypothetical protein